MQNLSAVQTQNSHILTFATSEKANSEDKMGSFIILGLKNTCLCKLIMKHHEVIGESGIWMEVSAGSAPRERRGELGGMLRAKIPCGAHTNCRLPSSTSCPVCRTRRSLWCGPRGSRFSSLPAAVASAQPVLYS